MDSTMKRLPLREQPQWRVSYQPGKCSLVELIGVAIGGKHPILTAGILIDRFGSINALASAPVEELASVDGVGRARAAALKASIEFGRRLNHVHEDRSPAIQSPEDAAALLMHKMMGLEQEYLYALLLNTRSRLIGEPIEVYHGSLNTSLIRIGEVLRPAIRANAAAIIVAHNHPSGDPTPSPEDVGVTKAMVQAGKLLDVEILDHLVIGKGRYVSLKNRGLGF